MSAHHVLFFGDSFVAGFGDPDGLGWVGRAVAAGWAAGHTLTAYNLGVRGETSAQVLRRWEAEAAPRVVAGARCGVVLSFGANDTTVDGGRPRVASEESVANLDRALVGATRLGLRAFVVGPAPAGDRDQHQHISRLSDAYAALARERGVPYVDVIGPLRESASWRAEAEAGDGVHPASAGYAELARLVTDPWLAWLAG